MSNDKRSAAQFTRVAMDDLDRYIDTLCFLEKEFTVRRTRTSAILKHGGETLMFVDDPIPLKHLHLLKRVKSDVRASEAAGPLYENDGRACRALLLPVDAPPFSMSGGFEIDVSNFYTRQAGRLGYLTPDTCARLLELNGEHKRVRQVALGSLATVYTDFAYAGGGLVARSAARRDKRLASAFFHVRASCDELARAVALAHPVAAYWVDNFVTLAHPGAVVAHLGRLGFASTVTPLRSLTFDDLDNALALEYPDGRTGKRFTFGHDLAGEGRAEPLSAGAGAAARARVAEHVAAIARGDIELAHDRSRVRTLPEG